MSLGRNHFIMKITNNTVGYSLGCKTVLGRSAGTTYPWLIMRILIFILLLGITSCSGIHEKGVYKYNFRGVLKKSYNDPRNHMAFTFLLENNGEQFERLSEDFPRCWEYAEIGDSVIKLPDTLIIIIKKKHEQKVFQYKY